MIPSFGGFFLDPWPQGQPRSRHRPRSPLALGLISSLWIAACQPSPPPTLTPFTPPGETFSVASPQPLATEQETLETELGDIEIFSFTTEVEGVVYAVAYSDYPEAIAADLDPQRVLDGSRDGAVANVQGRLIQERAVTLGEHPGRELTIEANPNTEDRAQVRVRLYLVGSRLYQVLVVVPRDRPDPGTTEQFLESFTLTPG